MNHSYAADKLFTDTMHGEGFREKGLCKIKEIDDVTLPWEHYFVESWVNPKNLEGNERKVFIWIKE